jgi:hypothetical protein
MRASPIGLTKKSQGWQMGVSKTLPISKEKRWHILMDQLGFLIGLNDEKKINLKKKLF